MTLVNLRNSSIIEEASMRRNIVRMILISLVGFFAALGIFMMALRALVIRWVRHDWRISG